MEQDKSRIELVLPHCLVNSYMARIYKRNIIRLQNAHGREVIFLVHSRALQSFRFRKLLQIEEWTSPFQSSHQDNQITYINCSIWSTDKKIRVHIANLGWNQQNQLGRFQKLAWTVWLGFSKKWAKPVFTVQIKFKSKTMGTHLISW